MYIVNKMNKLSKHLNCLQTSLIRKHPNSISSRSYIFKWKVKTIFIRSQTKDFDFSQRVHKDPFHL